MKAAHELLLRKWQTYEADLRLKQRNLIRLGIRPRFFDGLTPEVMAGCELAYYAEKYTEGVAEAAAANLKLRASRNVADGHFIENAMLWLKAAALIENANA